MTMVPSKWPGVVPYQYSTSNRNLALAIFAEYALFLINILHQTATSRWFFSATRSCSLSIFYIKPQHPGSSALNLIVVPYQYSTSNRNYDKEETVVRVVVPYQYSTSNRNRRFPSVPFHLLFLINILHQTATTTCCLPLRMMLFLINILHQTATRQQQTCREQRLFLINILHQTATIYLLHHF